MWTCSSLQQTVLRTISVPSVVGHVSRERQAWRSGSDTARFVRCAACDARHTICAEARRDPDSWGTGKEPGHLCMIAAGYARKCRAPIKDTTVRPAFLFAAVAVWAMCASDLRAQEVPGCGVLQNAYGPFDYRDPVNKRDNLPIVETFHFTADVESLRHGRSGSVYGDLRYTLRAFPNHHRALRSMARYGIEGGQIPMDDDISTVDCYFERAIVFRPDDAAVHVIYANYLFKRGARDDAQKQYEEALRLGPDSVEINYVAGLFFVDMGDLARARELAKIAYDNGYPLPGLKKKIAAAEAAQARKSTQ